MIAHSFRVSLLVLLSVLLAACGSDTDSGTEDKNAGDQAPTETNSTNQDAIEMTDTPPNPALEARMAYKAENEAFAETWRQQDGVILLPSGVAYKVTKEGEGTTPEPADIVTVRYKGQLIDGTVFDEKSGDDSINFPVNGVIKGWQDILVRMKPGASVEAMIPQDQAYGGQDRGPIPAFSTLLFTIELISAQSEADQRAALEGPGKAYLEENGTKEGVITTENGLQYKVLEEGDGVTPTEDSTVRFHYEGRTIDGFVFDSSYTKDQPMMLPINRAFPGWKEALMLMPTGSKFEIAIPHELAFGGRAISKEVPAYSTLVFTLELLSSSDPALEAAYLEENRVKDGWQIRDSGLQYRVVQEGEGESPIRTSKVKVHYAGKLIDGTQFDSSYDRGEPAIFPVSAVIEGWTEGLRLMKPGAIFEFAIPSKLGYGPQGSGNIPPNATLLFTVELLEVYN